MKRVVITSIGGVSPTGIGIDEIVNSMVEGKSGIGEITHFDVDEYNQGRGEKVYIAGEVDIDFKDYLTKDGDLKLIKQLDRFGALGLVALDEAVANIEKVNDKNNKNRNNYRMGAALGTGIGGLPLIESTREQSLTPEKTLSLLYPSLKDNSWTKDALSFIENLVGKNISSRKRMSALFVQNAMANGFLAHSVGRYDLMGPTGCTIQACASGAYNTAFAYDKIKLNQADLMIAGAAESTISPVGIGCFQAMQALNRTSQNPPEKASRPFDRDRSGFVMGEGSGVIVLEDYKQVIESKREDSILAEIIGYGTLTDTHHITLPNESGLPLYHTINMALNMAGINPVEVDYINAHGTSTGPNDKVEAKVIREIFGDKPYVSSTKSMTGHLLGAASALEQVYCILSHHIGIPPNINLDNIDKDCEGLNYATEFVEEKPKVVLNLSNGFGGHLAAILTRTYEG